MEHWTVDLLEPLEELVVETICKNSSLDEVSAHVDLPLGNVECFSLVGHLYNI